MEVEVEDTDQDGDQVTRIIDTFKLMNDTKDLKASQPLIPKRMSLWAILIQIN